MFVKDILDRIIEYKEKVDKRFDVLREQIAEFVCDVALGRVKEGQLKRLAQACTPSIGYKAFGDDFSLISRGGRFWRDKQGFEEQDETLCVNCRCERRKHSKDGNCPDA